MVFYRPIRYRAIRKHIMRVILCTPTNFHFREKPQNSYLNSTYAIQLYRIQDCQVLTWMQVNVRIALLFIPPLV